MTNDEFPPTLPNGAPKLTLDEYIAIRDADPEVQSLREAVRRVTHPLRTDLDGIEARYPNPLNIPRLSEAKMAFRQAVHDVRALLTRVRTAEAERDEAETVITTLLLLADDAEQVHSTDSVDERLRKVYLLILRHWRHIETEQEQTEADELNANLRSDLTDSTEALS